MRLTLRTLLAWLDDTLPAAEVKQIGQQVDESTFAQELVERIRRVTRQRRLSVPNHSGADAADPNLVAEYLDGALTADQVADYEKLCLKSDVHLAEVASTHQILSLIGQKAKVPVEARTRMYRLIRGPETRKPAVSAPPPTKSEPEPRRAVALPEVPEVPAADAVLPVTSPWQTYRPWAAAAALLGMLGFAAWRVVGPGPGTPDAGFLVKNRNTGSAGSRAVVETPEARPPVVPLNPEAMPSAPDLTMPPEATPAGEPNAPAKPDAMPDRTTPAVATPADVPGTADGSASILLRRRPDSPSWERVVGRTALMAGDLVLGLEPFRAPLRIGPLAVELVDQAEVRLLAPAADGAPRWQLLRGRVVVSPSEEGKPFEVVLAGPAATVDPTTPTARIIPSTAPIGLEMVALRESGRGSLLRLHTSGGRTSVKEGEREFVLEEPGQLDLPIPGREPPAGAAPAQRPEPRPRSAPEWLATTKAASSDLQRGEMFLKAYRGDRDVIPGLLEATANDKKEARELAMAALAALDDFDLVIEAMATPNQRAERLSAIKVLRSVLDRRPDGRVALSNALERVGGKDAEWAATVERLLAGFTAEEATDEVLGRLVDLLTHQDVEVRELAIDNLMTVTRRDSQGYDPDNPRRGPGLEEWQDGLRKKKLRP